VLRVEQKELARVLTRARKAVAHRTALEALAGVLITANDDGVLVTATDMDVRCELELDAEADGVFTALVNHKQLADAVRVLNKVEIVELHETESGIELRSGNRSSSLTGLRFDDWPGGLGLAEDERVEIVHANGAEFAEAVAVAATHAGTDDTRPILTALRFERRVFARSDGDPLLVATDSYRLLVTELPGALEHLDGVNVPAKHMVTATAKLDDDEGVLVEQYSRHVVVRRTGETWTMRVIDGQYPNWQMLMPDDYEVEVIADREELIDQARAGVASPATDKNSPLRLRVLKTQMVVSARQGGETFEARLRVKTTELSVGARCEVPFEIGVNPVFFAEAVEAGTSEQVELRFVSPLRPIVVMDGDAGPRVLLMPIRLNA
jgi:DNA polymerase-3 subunit beta